MGDKKKQEEQSVSPWDPFREMGLFQRGGLFPNWGSISEPFFRDWSAGPGDLSPAIDIDENDKQYIVTAELPGVGKDDISLELSGDLLTIRGEKKSEREEKKDKSRWVERRFGSFTRCLTLPADAHGERVDAKFKDGVLKVKIQKGEESKSKTIAIKD